MSAIITSAVRPLILTAIACAIFPTYCHPLKPESINILSAAPTGCNAEDQSRSSVRVKDIVGAYKKSVSELPAYAYPSEEKRTGYNYLAITSEGGNKLRVRLATKEINGHDCGFDSKGLLCGPTIHLIPNEEEKLALESAKQPIPSLRVTEQSIEFTPNSDGTVVSGGPYCGNRGALNHRFDRGSRALRIENSVFKQ